MVHWGFIFGNSGGPETETSADLRMVVPTTGGPNGMATTFWHTRVDHHIYSALIDQ